jgi:hypothetical protein
MAEEEEEGEFVEYREVGWEEIEYERVRRIGRSTEELIGGGGGGVFERFWSVCICNWREGSLRTEFWIAYVLKRIRILVWGQVELGIRVWICGRFRREKVLEIMDELIFYRSLRTWTWRSLV